MDQLLHYDVHVQSLVPAYQEYVVKTALEESGPDVQQCRLAN